MNLQHVRHISHKGRAGVEIKNSIATEISP
jgi:hypothetical protein